MSNRTRTLLAVALLCIGGIVMFFYGRRAWHSYQELKYIRQQGFGRAEAQVEDLRAWMPFGFVAVTYAVPEPYLLQALGLPTDTNTQNKPLFMVERDYLSHAPIQHGKEPAILQTVRDAIASYRANPVATGKPPIGEWVSLQYVANCMGVPVSIFFEQLDLPQAGNEYLPLDLLAKEQDYAGGKSALVQAVNAVADELTQQP
ncbi:MAG TPA: hypothetical protein PK299_13125 [Anaerolineales bacterium]|nr:hypothetical protein [Anaerolineales bacterium]